MIKIRICLPTYKRNNLALQTMTYFLNTQQSSINKRVSTPIYGGCDICRFCPSVFFYLLCVVPAIWFLELDQLNKRMSLKENINATGQVGNALTAINETVEDLSASIAGLGVGIQTNPL